MNKGTERSTLVSKVIPTPIPPLCDGGNKFKQFDGLLLSFNHSISFKGADYFPNILQNIFFDWINSYGLCIGSRRGLNVIGWSVYKGNNDIKQHSGCTYY